MRRIYIAAALALGISMLLVLLEPVVAPISPVRQASAQGVQPLGDGNCQDLSTGAICPCCYDTLGNPYLCCGGGGYGGYYGGWWGPRWHHHRHHPHHGQFHDRGGGRHFGGHGGGGHMGGGHGGGHR